VKSPVEFAVGIARALGGRVNCTVLAQRLEGLGQHLFHPPSVKGWDGGQAWLNAQTLLYRQNLALELCKADGDQLTLYPPRPDPAALARVHGQADGAGAVDFFLALFLQDDVPPASREQLTQYLADARRQRASAYEPDDAAAAHPVRAVCHLILTLPEYQLN
jgi:hypothetical protein